MEINWNHQLAEQIDYYWREQARPRLAGLSDEEYFWEPVPHAWNVRRRGTSTAPMAAGLGDFTIDWAYPEPEPAPITTIAWRLGHIIVGVLGMRVAAHFDGPALDYANFTYAGSANQALAQLEEQYAAWLTGVQSLGLEGLARPCGKAEGPYADHPMAELVLHINREVIHHCAEIALLRDLYVHRNLTRAGARAG